VGEVRFYHLAERPLESVLPVLLEKSLERGWRVLVRGTEPARIEALTNHLWTYRDDSFLPHGTPAAPHPELQPVYLTLGPEIPNRANILMLVEGGRATVAEMGRFERTCLLFDGTDPGVVDTARGDWRAVTAAGLPAKYWAQERGTWVQKASS
jgi:DNA polymerase-3 subunit chi